MSLPLPRNAKQILDLRLAGRRPADPVIVSFCGQTAWPNPHVFAESGCEYDWRFLYGLTALVFVKRGVNARNAIVGVFDETDHAAGLPILVDPELNQAMFIVGNRPVRTVQIPHATAWWKQIFEECAA